MTPSQFMSVSRALSGGDTVDAHRRVMQDRPLFLLRERPQGVAVGIDKRAIGSPQLLDRKVRSEQTPAGAEDSHGLADHMSDVRGIVAMPERAEPGQLGDHIRT